MTNNHIKHCAILAAATQSIFAEGVTVDPNIQAANLLNAQMQQAAPAQNGGMVSAPGAVQPMQAPVGMVMPNNQPTVMPAQIDPATGLPVVVNAAPPQVQQIAPAGVAVQMPAQNVAINQPVVQTPAQTDVQGTSLLADIKKESEKKADNLDTLFDGITEVKEKQKPADEKFTADKSEIKTFFEQLRVGEKKDLISFLEKFLSYVMIDISTPSDSMFATDEVSKTKIKTRWENSKPQIEKLLDPGADLSPYAMIYFMVSLSKDANQAEYVGDSVKILKDPDNTTLLKEFLDKFIHIVA